ARRVSAWNGTPKGASREATAGEVEVRECLDDIGRRTRMKRRHSRTALHSVVASRLTPSIALPRHSRAWLLFVLAPRLKNYLPSPLCGGDRESFLTFLRLSRFVVRHFAVRALGVPQKLSPPWVF